MIETGQQSRQDRLLKVVADFERMAAAMETGPGLRELAAKILQGRVAGGSS